MGEVVEKDFGKQDRESARRLARLLKLLQEQEADMLANPGKYMDMAAKRLGEQEHFIHSLRDALHIPIKFDWMSPDSLEPPELFESAGIYVPRNRWEALLRVEQLIRSRAY